MIKTENSFILKKMLFSVFFADFFLRNFYRKKRNFGNIAE